MSIITQQIGLSDKTVNGRTLNIGTMFGNGIAVSPSQARLSDESKKTSGYFSGAIQGGADSRKNLYPDNNNPFVVISTNYQGIENIRPPKPIPVEHPP